MVRHELGKEGSLINKAVWENTGLIPKYYKPYSLIETAEKTNPAPLYRCDFCKLIYKGKLLIYVTYLCYVLMLRNDVM